MRPAPGLRATIGGWRTRFAPNRTSPFTTRNSQLVTGEFLGKLDRLSLGIGQDLIHGLMGEHQAQRRTTGIEFADYRQYRPGDDLRRVDWNAYARLGTLHVRQAQAEHDTALYLLVDASPSMDFGDPPKFLSARRLAAALGYIALAHLDSVALVAPGRVPGVGDRVSGTATAHNTQLRGRAEAGKLFRELQEMRTGEAVPFDEMLSGWTAKRGQGRVAVIISDLLLDGYRDGVQRLVGAGFQVTLLHILSPEELRPPDEGNVELVDSETGQKLEIRLGVESLGEYRRRLNLWLAETEGWCREHGAGYLLVQSDWEVERVLLDTLKRRGVTA